eukprot:GHVU01039020.1.p1 GENE.GHVU01039020.1~~GHVU01039020.1.p1  ORF type:complete len:176 (+),score=30.09 GHVU01039020.1:744-1271(+)
MLDSIVSMGEESASDPGLRYVDRIAAVLAEEYEDQQLAKNVARELYRGLLIMSKAPKEDKVDMPVGRLSEAWKLVASNTQLYRELNEECLLPGKREYVEHTTSPDRVVDRARKVERLKDIYWYKFGLVPPADIWAESGPAGGTAPPGNRRKRQKTVEEELKSSLPFTSASNKTNE